MYTILRRETFSDTTFLWEVLAPDVAMSAEPGHFIMLRLHEGSERIPLTVADYDRDRGSVTMVIQALGRTTREMRDRYRKGDTFLDFVGPLGLPQHVDTVGHVVLVGGGLGVAPVYPQLRAFHHAGNRTTGIIGFRNKDLVFWEDRFASTATSSSSAPTTAATASPASSPPRSRMSANGTSPTWWSPSARCR